MTTIVMSGDVKAGFLDDSKANGSVIVLPRAVTADCPASIAFGSDFGTVAVRVAVYADGSGWRVYDPVMVGDADTSFVLALSPGDHKVSIGRDKASAVSGDTGIWPAGWTISATV